MATALFALCFVKFEYIILLTVGLATLLVVSLIVPKIRQAVVIPLSLSSAVAACLLFVAVTNIVVQPVKSLENTSASCSFYVTDCGKITDNYKEYTAKITQIDDESVNVKSTIYLDENVNIRPYTVVKGNLKFKSVGDDAMSSYGKYADGIYIRANCTLTDYVGQTIRSPFRYVVALRHSIRNKLSYLMANREGGLSVALVTGDKSYLLNDVKTAFMYSGTSHIMAVSGLHLSVVTGALFFILKSLKVKEKTSSVVCIAAVIVYMALAAFSGSVTRAGIMMIILLSARLFSMRGDSLNSLGASLTVMCLANPYAVSDVGTDLSVMSVLALITVYPLVLKNFKANYADPLEKSVKEKANDRLYSTFGMFYSSVFVFVLNIPILYIFFGYTSIIGPLSNLAAVPLGSLCVVMSFITYFVSLLGITPLISVAVVLSTKCDALLIKICEFFRAFNNSVLGFDYMVGICIAAVLLFFAVAFIMGGKVIKNTCVLSVAFAVLFVGTLSVYNYNRLSLRIFQNGAIVCTYKDKTVVYGVNTDWDKTSVSSYLQNNSMPVDYLVTQRSFSEPSSLSNEVSVSTVVCNEFDDNILVGARFNNLEVQNTYNVALDENLSFCYNQGDIIIKFNDITIGSTDDCDIKVSSSKVVEPNGTIKLEKYDTVTYKIKSKNSFKVRRLNQWQK